MAAMTAVFKATDEITDKLDRMASSGSRMMEQIDTASGSMNAAFSSVKTGIDTGAEAMNKFINEAESLSNGIKENSAELEELQKAYIGAAMQFGKNSEEANAFKNEIDDLSKYIDENKQQYEDLTKESGMMGEKMSGSIEQIQGALVAAGIAKLVSEITNEVIKLANSFSEAESVIVKATGATGAKLDSLSGSMMSVYGTAVTGDLSTVAGAIGEISTRLGLQGSELERVSSLFLDYANVTNTNVVSSVENISKVMNNWGVQAADIEGLMDKFVKAAQMSGASVDELSGAVYENKAILEPLGLTLEESIGLMALMEQQGINTSNTMLALRSAVNYFAREGIERDTR